MAPTPVVIKELDGAGKVFDYRGTGLLRPSGGLIQPQIMVEHIPLVRNEPGTDDFVALANVLNGRRLAVHAATDREGNVALYTPLNRRCDHAKGANQVSCGVEHMHVSLDEAWTKKQFRAAAWLWQLAEREFGIPLRIARVRSGGHGRIEVLRRGHTSHKRVADAAGFHHKTDPGSGFDWELVRANALFFKRHGHFVGA